MIVVCDSNVWISALLSATRGGKPSRALEKAGMQHGLATCDQIELEIMRILSVKFLWGPDRIEAALRPLLKFAFKVPVHGNLRVCRDPYDDMVLECAVISGAEVIVTGDKDLLVLNPYQGIRIVTPAEFLELAIEPA